MPTVLAAQGQPFAKAPDINLSTAQQQTALRTVVESLPGASEWVGVREGHEAGMQIGPALRDGRYRDAAWAAINSIAAPVASLIGVHLTPAFAGVMRAYHGSPHVFDEFKSAAIGTGEGAQAYGHGLYFAENEKVARGYQADLAPKSSVGTIVDVDGQPLSAVLGDLPQLGKTKIGLALERHGGNFTAALDDLKTQAAVVDQTTTPKAAAFWERTVAAAAQLRDKKVTIGDRPRGALYDVHLDVNFDELLHWDKPLRDQPEKVQVAVAKRLEQVLDDPKSIPMNDVFDRFESGDLTGQEIYGLMGRGTPESSSAALRDAGIPGLRYLDAGSRSAADGTHNIVMFDDSRISIRARNGQPLPTNAEQSKAAMAGLVPTTTLGRP